MTDFPDATEILVTTLASILDTRTERTAGDPLPSAQVRRASGGGLDIPWSHNWHTQEVSLDLHEQVIACGASINAERTQRDAGIRSHCADNVANLERDGLKRRARDVTAGRTSRDPEDRATGRGIPVRCAEAREGGHKRDTR